MNLFFLKKYSTLFLIPILAGGLSACGYSKAPINQGAKTESAQSQNGTHILQNTKVDRALGLRVVDISDDIPGVKNATAVANGKDIVVGVKGKDGTDPKKLVNLVYQTLKKREPGYNIHVTADPNQYKRINTLASRMNKITIKNNSVVNRDNQNIDQEMTKLIREIT